MQLLVSSYLSYFANSFHKCAVTVTQPARASHDDHVTEPAVLGTRNTDWSRYSLSDYRTSRTSV